MSIGVDYFIAPAIPIPWTALLPGVVTGAGILGYSALGKDKQIDPSIQKLNPLNLPLPKTDIIIQALEKESEILFSKENLQREFHLDNPGKCKIHVRDSRPQVRPCQIGNEFTREIIQDFLYNKVTNELPQK